MRRFKVTLIGLIVLLVAAVGYGYGCGGDDGGDGSGQRIESVGGETGDGTGPVTNSEAAEEEDGTDGGDGEPLTKAQFVKQADEVCEKVPTKYTEKVQELEQQAQQQNQPKPTTAELNLQAAIPPLPEAASELEALKPPEGDEEEAEAIVAALEAAAQGLEEKPTSPLAGPKSPFAEFQRLTRQYGMALCSQL